MNIFNTVKTLFVGTASQPTHETASAPENKVITAPQTAAPTPTPAAAPLAMADSITPADISTRFSLLENERKARQMEVEMEADAIRRTNRAQTAGLIEANRQAELRRQRQQVEADAERSKKISRPQTWEEIHLPFITSVDRGDSLRIRAELPGITKKFLLTLIERGNLEQLRVKTAKAISPHILAWETAWNERAGLNFDVVRKQLRESIESNIAAVKAGHAADIRPVIDREEVEKTFAPKRAACREMQKAASSAAFPHVSAFAAALQSAARDLAVDMVAREKILADEWVVPFSPSPWTRVVILAGFDIQNRIELFSTGSGSSPAELLFGLLDSRKK
jgi:hypothetical protein